MLITADDSCLLLIDLQKRLVPAVPDGRSVVENCAWLVEIANILSVPVLVSEQYPEGLGQTVSRLANLVHKSAVMEKVHFSCMASAACCERIEGLGCRQMVVAGMESHVCLLQTVLDLKQSGYEVFVVADAVASIRSADRDLAFVRMRDEGVRLVSRAMVAYEWLRKADTDQFREINRHYLR